jgi:hypothetical protein
MPRIIAGTDMPLFYHYNLSCSGLWMVVAAAVEAREASNMTWKSSCWAGGGGPRSGACGVRKKGGGRGRTRRKVVDVCILQGKCFYTRPCMSMNFASSTACLCTHPPLPPSLPPSPSLQSRSRRDRSPRPEAPQWGRRFVGPRPDYLATSPRACHSAFVAGTV